MESLVFKTKFYGRELEIEIGKFALQASGAVLAKFGKTTVLCTATLAQKDSESDFLPLLVDYQERYYAARKIIGSKYVRREGKPTDEAILTSRLIDRAIRPYFPQNLRREIHLVITTLSYDEENDPEFPSLIGSSLALFISEIPWKGPVGGVRVAFDGKSFLPFPTVAQASNSKMNLFVSGVEDESGEILVNMLEGEAKEVKEDEFLKAIQVAKKEIKKLIDFQKEIQKQVGKQKILEELFLKPDPKEIEALFEKYYPQIRKNLLLMKEKEGKRLSLSAQTKLQEELGLDSFTFEKLVSKSLSYLILNENLRPDGRKEDEIREIECLAGIIPYTHGSGFFRRGLTQVLSILTLGAPGDELLLEGMKISGKKRFLHHYNFPPYSAGETGALKAPSRREIGHGALVEKALRPLVPETTDFPYAIRVVSEVLSSNGSTSMASVCASSLALFDGGVPLKKAVAGISCGLIQEGQKEKVLTDIQGPEDQLGGMDFKVAGTKDGITAVQLDVKVRGLSEKIIQKTLAKALSARKFILEKMEKVLPRPRTSLSPLAPKILSLTISPEKIREVIGPEGKTIKQIISHTHTTIDIEEDGQIFITGETWEGVENAAKWIKDITREIKEGEIFEGRVKRVMNFGVIFELFPGQDALLHISEIFREKMPPEILKKYFHLGDVISVKVKRIDENGRVFLTLPKGKLR